MRRILLTILLTAMPACAFEDYMIISETPVKSVTVQDPEILTAKPVFTIDNEKKIIIVTPQKAGKTKVTVNLYEETKSLDIKVNENKTTIKPQAGFNYYLMDIPPHGITIPFPPANIILPQPPKYKGGK